MSHLDVVAHAMGVIAVNCEGTHYINKTIVPANQKIPVKCAEAFHYYTSARGENEVEIYVLQGTKAPLECQIIGNMSSPASLITARTIRRPSRSSTATTSTV